MQISINVLKFNAAWGKADLVIFLRCTNRRWCVNLVVNATRVISYKCPFCGDFVVSDFSVFNVTAQNTFVGSCACGESEIRVSRHGKNYFFETPCVYCDNNHLVRVDFKSVLHKDRINIACPLSDFSLCAAGSADFVNSWIDGYERELEALLDFGDSFADDHVMFGVIEEINDIADENKLYCGCGGYNIEMELLYDSVVLFCMSCNAKKSIPAQTAADLNNIQGLGEIVITPKTEHNKGEKSKVIVLNLKPAEV